MLFLSFDLIDFPKVNQKTQKCIYLEMPLSANVSIKSYSIGNVRVVDWLPSLDPYH